MDEEVLTEILVMIDVMIETIEALVDLVAAQEVVKEDNTEREIGIAENAIIKILHGEMNAIVVMHRNLMAELDAQTAFKEIVGMVTVEMEIVEMEIETLIEEVWEDKIAQVVDLTANGHINFQILVNLLTYNFLSFPLWKFICIFWKIQQ